MDEEASQEEPKAGKVDPLKGGADLSSDVRQRLHLLLLLSLLFPTSAFQPPPSAPTAITAAGAAES